MAKTQSTASACSWFLVLFLLAPAGAAEFWVAPAGEDSASGAQDKPFRTIQRGVNAAQAGDTVFVRAGRYEEHVNLAAGKDMDYTVAAGIVADIVRALGRNGIGKGTFLNVNIPDLPKESIRGVRITKQVTRAPIDFFERSVSPEGATLYKPSWKHLEPAGEDTDIWAVRNGYVSVSVFGIDQSAAAGTTARKSLERLEKLAWK
jgi:hypothetical protein